MQVPVLLRQFLVSSGVDANWGALQTVPAASICANVTGVNTIGFTFVPYTAGGAVTTGTLDVQLVDVSTPVNPNSAGIAVPATLITVSPVQVDWAVGAGLTYDVSASRLITLRISKISSLNVAAVSLKIFWRALS